MSNCKENKDQIDPGKHKKWIRQFSDVQKHYVTYSKVLEKILHKACEAIAPRAIVTTRVKTSSSYAEKIIRKNKYTDPLRQITDICGARVLVNTLNEVEQVCHFLRHHFTIDEKNSINVKSRLDVSQFGYLSIHIIISPGKKKILGINIPNEIKDLKAEIQVRTMLQHAWSDVLHDRMYKTCIRVPQELRRESFGAAAILENADKLLNELAGRIDHFLNNYAAFLPAGKLKEETKTLEAILKYEPDKNNKPLIALNLAKALNVQGEWEKIIALLKPYKAIKSKLKPQIILELGNALCQSYCRRPEAPEFRYGLNLLKQITRLQDKLDTAGKTDNEVSALKARAWALLGEAYKNCGKYPEEAHKCFLQAFELDIYNPYFLINYLEWELKIHHDRRILKPLAHALKFGIEKCEEHILVGVEVLKAYLTIGKFRLLLNEPYKSLDAYAKAIDLCISGVACVRDDIAIAELDALERLFPENVKPPAFQWIQMLLRLAESAKSKINDTIKEYVIHTEGFKPPLMIIAGDAGMMDEDKRPAVENELFEWLIKFRGTIISGGTTAGIPGAVGKVKTRINKSGNNQIVLIGYIPEKLPGKAHADDKNYDHIITTKSKDFSALEPLHNWVDIITAGILPREVKVLGFGGGPIADFEYKLALCLGAKVGVIGSSSRAVSELINDEKWSSHPNLAILPDDPMTMKAFLHISGAPRLTEEQILKAAKHVHKRYCLTRKAEALDERTVPWKKLKETYKNSNISQVKYIEEVLNAINYGVRAAAKGKKPVLPEFTEEEIEKMAEIEHGRWNAEKLSSGWKYGKERDNEKKLNPSIVPWHEFHDKTKQLDRDAVKEFPKILKEAGFEIYKLKS